MRPPLFCAIDPRLLVAVTGGLSSTIRTRRQAPEVPTGQPSAIEQRMAGLTSVLGQIGKGAAQPAPQPATPSPMGGLGGLGGLGMPMG